MAQGADETIAAYEARITNTTSWLTRFSKEFVNQINYNVLTVIPGNAVGYGIHQAMDKNSGNWWSGFMEGNIDGVGVNGAPFGAYMMLTCAFSPNGIRANAIAYSIAENTWFKPVIACGDPWANKQWLDNKYGN